MTICQFCGTSLMEGARFCYKCEEKLEYPEKEEGGEEEEEEEKTEQNDTEKSEDPLKDVTKARVEDLDHPEWIKYCPSCSAPMFEFNSPVKCEGCGAFYCLLCEMAFRSEKRTDDETPLCMDCLELPPEPGVDIPMDKVETETETETEAEEETVVEAKTETEEKNKVEKEEKKEEGKINNYRCTLCKKTFSAKSKGKKYDVICPHCKGRITIG